MPVKRQHIVKAGSRPGGYITLPFAGYRHTQSAAPSGPTAQDYFDAVSAAGGSLTSQQQSAITTWFATERTAGRLDKYKAVYPMMGGNLASVKINMVNPGTYDLTLYNFVEADVDLICGLKGDGSTKYAEINGYASSIFDSSNDVQISLFILNYEYTGTNSPLAVLNSSTSEMINFTMNSVNAYNQIGSNAIAVITPAINNHTTFSFTRYSSTSLNSYKNNSSKVSDSTLNSIGLPSLNPFLFARNTDGSPGFFSNILLEGTFFAQGLNETDLFAANTSYQTLLDNLIDWDTDAQAYIDALEAENAVLSYETKYYYNEFVKTAKTNNYYSGLRTLHPYMGGNLNAGLIDAISASHIVTNSNFVDGDFDSLIGLTGDASTKYLNLGASTSLFTRMDNVIFGTFYLSTPASGVNRFPMGVRDQDVNNSWIYIRQVTSDEWVGYISTGTSTVAEPTEINSGIAIFRDSVIDQYIIKNGSATSSSNNVTGVSVAQDDFYLFARNDDGSADGFVDDKLSGHFTAQGLSVADVAQFQEDYLNFLTNIGAII